MTNTKGLRAEVEAFGEDMVDVEVGTEIELKKFAIQCATSPDSPLLAKALEQLEQDRQVQGSCISTLKSLKHSGTLNPRAYEAVENLIEVLFNHQRTTFDQLKEIRECMESFK